MKYFNNNRKYNAPKTVGTQTQSLKYTYNYYYHYYYPVMQYNKQRTDRNQFDASCCFTLKYERVELL